MLKIRSTEKLATSNTKGNCDVERVIKDYRDIYNENGTKIGTIIIIKSRFFQEKTIIKKVTEGENEEVTERKYIIGNDHEKDWFFTNNEIEGFKKKLQPLLKNKTEDEQRLIVFIAQTQTAGENGKGWQGMSNWIPDQNYYKVVSEFTKIEEEKTKVKRDK